MNNRTRSLLIAFACLLLPGTLLSSVASAQGDEEPKDGGTVVEDAGSEEGKVDPLVVLEEANNWARKRQYKKAIPLYKEVLRAEPERYPSVYYNLAEIKRFQDDCGEAVILYQRYLLLLPDSRDKGQIAKAIAGCQVKLGALGKLAVSVTGPEAANFHVNGIPVTTGPKFEIELKPGKYTLLITAIDHDPYEATVSVPAEGATMEIPLKLQIFHGDLALKVDQDGAAVSVDGQALGSTPLKPTRVVAGKHYVEVSKAGYYKWVRNVFVTRDDTLSVDIQLEKLEP